MSYDDVTMRAFSDELTKIAGVGSAAKDVFKRGWNFGGAKWMGKGKLTKYLPIGEKTLGAAFPALELYSEAKSENKPDAQGRSKAERITRAIGGTAGSIAGIGLLGSGKSTYRSMGRGRMRYTGKRRPGFLATMGAGMLGGSVGAGAAGAPWSAARSFKNRHNKDREMTQRTGTK